MDGIEVVCMKGRFHFYEGHDMSTVVLPVRVMRLLGVKMLIVTNAAGGLKESLNVGDICVIQDHFAIVSKFDVLVLIVWRSAFLSYNQCKFTA